MGMPIFGSDSDPYVRYWGSKAQKGDENGEIAELFKRDAIVSWEEGNDKPLLGPFYIWTSEGPRLPIYDLPLLCREKERKPSKGVPDYSENMQSGENPTSSEGALEKTLD